MHGTHSPARGRHDKNPLAFGPQGLSHGIDQAFIGVPTKPSPPSSSRGISGGTCRLQGKRDHHAAAGHLQTPLEPRVREIYRRTVAILGFGFEAPTPAGGIPPDGPR
jgi:hypothetical protein